MVSHQQAQLRDNWTQTTRLFPQSFILCYILTVKPETAAMAKLSNGCTSTNVFVLLSLAVCVLLGSSAPTVHVRQANVAQELHHGLTLSVSY